MTRLVWLAGVAAVAAVALLIAFRGDAAASDASPGCAPAEGFIPAFCVNVPTTAVRRETSVPMTSLPSQRADVRAEVAIPDADIAVLAASVDRSVGRVEAELGRTFSARPRVLLFATSASFATGASELFGYSTATARDVANRYGGIFDRPTLTIALNWSASDRARMGAAVEHELAHQMVRELAGAGEVPAWLDEGLATLVEQAAGADSAAPEPLVGMAVASSGAVSLDDVATVARWHTAYARVGRPLYAYAANAVRAIEQRIGRDGLLALLGAVGAGQRFDAAYAAASGESVTDLERRLTAAGATPSIVVDPWLAADGNRAFTIFAGAAGAELHVSIAGGRGYSVSFTVRTDAFGMYRGSFGATALPGTYTVRAAGAETTFSTAP